MPSASEIYLERISTQDTLRARSHRLWSILGNLRLLAAIIAIFCLWQGRDVRSSPWLIVAGLASVLFLVLAYLQRRQGSERDAYQAQVLVNQRALARYEHRWRDLPQLPDSGADRSHPFAWDLNIIGHASIAQRIGTPVTYHGWRALYAALLGNRDLAELSERQVAIQELAPALDQRQRIEAEGSSGEVITDSSSLQEWAAGSNWLSHRVWLRRAAVFGPLLVGVATLLFVVGISPWPVILIPLLFNAGIYFASNARVNTQLQATRTLREIAPRYAHILSTIGSGSAAAAVLKRLVSDVYGGAEAMKQLIFLSSLAIPRGSLLYFPMQLLVQWDVNMLSRLEQWRDQHGKHVDTWLDAMGEWESLAALSVLAHDYPAWCVPEIDADLAELDTGKLTHPLLNQVMAVGNDVVIGPTGTFLFVTGSNMSGKSTLLRAIGANSVLAQAGTSVAARWYRSPPLRIVSCMRVEDSLEQGVSFFMAELQRLKLVVDRMSESDSSMGLYLLDEILQGTNTAERQIASRKVLEQLTGVHAIGAVSSHDLELIEGTVLEQSAQAVHFSEQFEYLNGVPTMTFDYTLRPGIATSSNAIRLMEIIGFDISE